MKTESDIAHVLRLEKENEAFRSGLENAANSLLAANSEINRLRELLSRSNYAMKNTIRDKQKNTGYMVPLTVEIDRELDLTVPL